MKDNDFILECIRRLTPDTSWYGETNHDNKSIENLNTLEDAIWILLNELLGYSYVPQGNRGNYSFEKIAEKKQKILSNILEELKEHIKNQ